MPCPKTRGRVCREPTLLGLHAPCVCGELAPPRGYFIKPHDNPMRPGSGPSCKDEETETQQRNLPRITKPTCDGPGGKQFCLPQAQQPVLRSPANTGGGPACTRHGARPGNAGFSRCPTHPLHGPTLGPRTFFPQKN